MLKKFKEQLKSKNIDGALIHNIHNVRYLSSYTSDDAFLLITEGTSYFITDPRYTEQAEKECPDFEIFNWRSRGTDLSDSILEIGEKEKIKRLGIEDESISLKEFKQIEKKLTVEFVPISGMVENLRKIKQPEEIENLKKACQISDRVFEKILNEIKVGVTEKELSAKLSYYLKLEGSDARGYENIFISGPRTSLLHGIPSERTIKEGDLVLMDYGAGYKGYLSDMTRTVVVGKATEEQREIYQIVKQSEEDLISAIKDNVPVKELYEASIAAMKNTKYFKYHYSGVGHGIGLAVHEKPFLSPKSDDIIQENNVVTTEPGIYIPEWGGIRIEDQVLVTKDGCELLTKAPRQLLEI
jgi:Xaa-Pro aminopeptidase